MTSPPADSALTAVPPSTDGRPFERGQWLVSSTASAVTAPTTFRLSGRDWDLLPGVFAPTHCLSTRFFSASIPYPDGGTLLEVGCGSGVISVLAATRGCARVTATDISPAAIENTLLNAARHAVTDRVRAVRGDLFDVLDRQEQFDLIFWNSPFIEPPECFIPRCDLDRAVFDPGYRQQRRFLSGARRRLTAAGRLLLGFSSLGKHAVLARQAADCGYGVRTLRTSGRMVPGVEYQLLELVSHQE
jgi:release factor glutamine methyltransferase